MSTAVEQRLRDHYAVLADELELPPSRFGHILARSAIPMGDRPKAPVGEPTTHPRSVRWVVVAAAALLFVVGGLSVLGRWSGDVARTGVTNEIDAPPTLLSSVNSLDADEWIVATRVPEGVVYMYAFAVDGAGSERWVWYGNDRESGTTERFRITVSPDASIGGEPIEIEGTEWEVDAPPNGGWMAVRRLATTAIVVSDSGPFDEEDRDVLAGLAVAKADGLPSAPLGESSDAIKVATDGEGADLLVQESAGYWLTEIAGNRSCCNRIDNTTDIITDEGGATDVAEGAPTARVVRGGTVSSIAELVQVEFSDGTVAEVSPTDLSGRFDRSFWVVSAVLPADDRSPVEVRAYDAEGRLLATVAAAP